MGNLKGFLGETIVYGLGNVFSRFFAMLLIPLYAKYLGKADYSNLIMLQSVFGILAIFLSLNSGVFYYYYEYQKQKYRRMVITTWFYYQLAASLVLLLLLSVFSGYFSNLFITEGSDIKIIKYSLIMVGLQLFPYVFNNTNINYYRIERKPKLVVQLVALEALFTVIFVFLSLHFFDYGLFGVVVSQIIARSLVAILYIDKAKFYTRLSFFSRKLLGKIVVYTWPFIITSIFSWVIISIDKFIGASVLTNKTQVALLALSMQLVLPLAVLSDMIRMAIGPFVMSIRKNLDAQKSYQEIFDVCVYAASMVVVGLIMFSPFLVLLLTNDEYIGVVKVLPLMALGQLFSIIANQFCVSFSLVKKNVYIMYAMVLGGIVGLLLNFALMGRFGYIVAGYSQVLSFLVMVIFLYYYGRKVAELSINLRTSFWVLSGILFYIGATYIVNPYVLKGNYFLLLFPGLLTIAIISLVFLYLKGLSVKVLVEKLTSLKRMKTH